MKTIEDTWKKEHKRHPKHPVVRAFVLPRLEIIRKTVEIDWETTILDVGCGNGWFTYYLDGLSNYVSGVDISKHMLKNNPCKNVFYGNAEDIPYDDNSFDVVFSSNLFHHLNNPKKAIDEFIRVSKKWIVITEPNPKSKLVRLFSHVKPYEDEIVNLPKVYDYIKTKNLKLIKNIDIGMVTPSSTPLWLLPILKLFDVKFKYANWNLRIWRKK